jgi:lipoprotein-anchoring transpeptidase ErfK/SrfK
MLTPAVSFRQKFFECELRKMLKVFVSALVASSVLAGPVLAQDRYAQRPGVVISPDLAAPWVMQLSKPRLKIKRSLPSPVTTRREIVIGATTTVRKAKRRLPEPAEPQDNIVRIGPDGLIQAVSLPQRQKKPRAEQGIDPIYLPQEVAYEGKEKRGTIVIDTSQRFLYLVEGNGIARRYGVGVGKEGFEWTGTQKISRKSEWPTWIPPEEMKIRVKAKEGRILPDRMEGGPDNPLGARAMYLGNSLYRIHGTNQPWTIGSAVSSGCIRMRNEDVTDLYERVKIGTKVIVR